MAFAVVAVFVGEELRIEDLLNVDERHDGRQRKWTRVQRAEGTEVEIDPIEILEHLGLVLKLNRALLPPVGLEARQLTGVVGIPEESVLVLRMTLTAVPETA